MILILIFTLACFGAFADQPPYQRNNLDTNLVAAAPADGWFLSSASSVPFWSLNGIDLTNLNLIQATNNDTVVSNGVVAHTITVAGTANQISSSVGTAQQLASNPSTTLSLPNPTLFPGTVQVSGLTNTANTLLQGAETNSTLISGFIVADSLGGRTARAINAGDVNFTWTNAINSTNVTITGPTQIYGDKFRTNGTFIGNGGEVLSNNLGQVVIQGGNISASGTISGNGSGITNLTHGRVFQQGGGVSTALAANATNYYFIIGANTSSANAVAPIPEDGSIIEMCAFTAGTINSGTNEFIEIFTNNGTSSPMVSAGIRVTLANGSTGLNWVTSSIPVLKSYGMCIGQSANGTALVSSQIHWGVKFAY